MSAAVCSVVPKVDTTELISLIAATKVDLSVVVNADLAHVAAAIASIIALFELFNVAISCF